LVVQDNEPSSKLALTGRVATSTAAGSLPVGGATLTLLSGLTTFDSTVSAADGSYAFRGLPPGSYRVMIAKIGATFAPTSRSVTMSTSSLSGLDFVATLRAQIAGTVLRPNADGTLSSLANVTITARSGGLTRSVRTDRNGRFLFDLMPLGLFEVTPALNGAAFSPRARSVRLDASNSLASGLTFSAGAATQATAATSASTLY
jgi:hypothetical protein